MTNLEELMANLIATVARTDEQLALLSAEMRDFKGEMQDFKDEMQDFKDEMQDFKDEMSDFKSEMRDYKEEERVARIEMRRQWGELSNKLGTMAEDLVAPSVGRILRETVGCPDDRIDMSAVRVRRFNPQTNVQREFDVVATCGDVLLINETKSRLGPEQISDFARRLPEARGFFPEYADRALIGAIASLYVDASLVQHGERLGLIVLGFGDDVMQVLNSPGFTPRRF
ncbi:MAG: hypothetical protein HC802_18540 [Caldilineaceae bacterium]|nr:hypothetical protein [Caldilineaceae bacterium]